MTRKIFQKSLNVATSKLLVSPYTRIEGRTFHDLRRTAVVRMAEAGCTIPEIASLSGHQLETTSRIIETYLPRNRRLAQAAVAKLEQWQPEFEPE